MPGDPLHLVFDLDGTLLAAPPRMNYEDASEVAAMRPIEQAVARLGTLRQKGHRFTVVTGRTEALRSVTLAQVAVVAGPDVGLVMQESWRGDHALARYKADALRRLGAHLFVGDNLSDRQAAVTAGVPFMAADAFRAGLPLPIPGASP